MPAKCVSVSKREALDKPVVAGLVGSRRRCSERVSFRTVGEVEPADGLTRTSFKVHLLESPSLSQQVGIEVVSSSGMSWRMLPLKLSREQAPRLSHLCPGLYGSGLEFQVESARWR